MIYSNDAEQAVLGSILTDGNMFVAVSHILKPESFYIETHKQIWRIMEELDLKQTAIDIFTVGDKFNDDSYLSDLIGMCVSTNTEAYAELVAEKARQRSVQAISRGIDDLVHEGAESAELIDYVGAELNGVTDSKKSGTQSIMGAAIKKLLDRTDKRFNGEENLFETGFKDLDDLMKLEGGRLVVIAGRPGMGKSTLAQNIVENAAKRGIPSQFETFEMEDTEVALRSVAAAGSVDSSFLKDPKTYESLNSDHGQWSALSAGVQATKDIPMQVNYCPGSTVSEIKNRARSFFRHNEHYKEKGEGILCIDYLGLIKIPGKDRVKELGQITKELKNFAGEMGIPVLLLVQLNRGVDSRDNKRPAMSDLRDSGEIEEDADAVMFVYRDEVYNPDSPDQGIAEIIIRKNRMGTQGTVRVASQLRYYRFQNLAAQNYS